ncbi:hypothetical protein C4D60_Mb04t29630 [Musa balbisiana]|uniref:Uncharacterized protein n=1 Tax=Musa balbisiana TaxID=52838 RepID=A0A4S8KFK2_MUSBA|nr:hypothetical protein C4D60_Mb04t29630 [Musa balbisiana]
MLHTILPIRIEPALYIYPHSSSRCEQWATVGTLHQVFPSSTISFSSYNSSSSFDLDFTT